MSKKQTGTSHEGGEGSTARVKFLENYSAKERTPSGNKKGKGEEKRRCDGSAFTSNAGKQRVKDDKNAELIHLKRISGQWK